MPPDLQSFSLHRFGEAIEKLAMLLDGAATGLSETVEWRNEAREAARENAEDVGDPEADD